MIQRSDLEKWARKKRFWLTVAFVLTLVFGQGAVFQLAGWLDDSKRHSREQLRLELEYEAQLKTCQEKIPLLIPSYIDLRDELDRQKLSLKSAGRVFADIEYALQNRYMLAKRKLVALVSQCNRIEAKLSKMDTRDPHLIDRYGFVPPRIPKELSGRWLGDVIELSFSFPDSDEAIVIGIKS